MGSCTNLEEIESLLFHGQRLTDDEIASLKYSLGLMKVDDLKSLSKRLGVRLTGTTRKGDITERLLGMARIGAINNRDDDTTPITISYLTDEVQKILSLLPPFSSVTQWTKTLKDVLKEFTFMNLLIYLVYGREKTFDMDSLKAFKSLKAYKYFYDGYVKNVWLYQCPIPAESNLRVLYFRAFVHHSFTSDAPLEVFVSVNGHNGDVYSAQCSCVSGLGQACNHVAALLFFIEHNAQNDELPTDTSKTSQPMKWNQPPKKSILPACANDMVFVKPSHGQTEGNTRIPRSSFDPRPTCHRALDKEAAEKLLCRIQKTIPSTGLSQFWRSRSSGLDVPSPTLWNHVLFSQKHATTVLRENLFVPTTPQCYEYLDKMKLDIDDVERIEAATRDQSDSELWHAMRNGRLTSSRFGEIRNRKETTNSRRLVRDIMGYGKQLKTLPPQILWGRENEQKAIKCYIEDRLTVGEEMTVTPSGLHLMPNKSYLGASSDGVVLCTNVDTLCRGCVEVKCPYSIEKCVTIELTPTEIANKFGNKFFLELGSDGDLHLRHNHHYYAQVQGEINILVVEWCDFVVYSNNTVVVDCVLADLEYWNELEQVLEDFYVRHVIPEILSSKIFMEEYNET